MSTQTMEAVRGYNFSAGPGTLPVGVLEEARDEMLSFSTAQASIMEVSHRSPEYSAVVEAARAHIRELLGLGDEWHILFLAGGASLQFYQVPLNFLPDGGVADYLNTGSWASKAVKEAKRVGSVNEIGSSKDENFSYIPERNTWKQSASAAYLHYTSNNTIYGTQIHGTPHVDSPLVCDASSDFLGAPLDVDRFGLIYAGAQKNVGPAGATIVLVRDDFLQTRRSDIPTILDYGTHTAKLFHTPPVFAVYMIEKVLRWLIDLGGLPAIQTINERKAGKLYAAIDDSEFYRGTARKDSRSLMNVTYRLPSEDLEKQFIAEAKGEGLLTLKGHRSVGGIRASIYNACPEEAVDALVAFMAEFERKNG